MRSKVYIVSPIDSNAARYAYDFVFKTFFEGEVQTLSSGEKLPSDAIAISHGVEGVKHAIFVPIASFLEDPKPIHPREVNQGSWDDFPTLFPDKGEIPFDIFSAVFYLLARVEEYAISERDSHGRFEWKNSILSSPEFKGKPIIDLWVKKFGEILKSKFPEFRPKERKFNWVNTFDIDIAYAYSHRSPLRIIAATGKNVLSGNLSSVSKRSQVLLKAVQDPFDTYAYQEEISRASECQTVYFFLLGSGGKMDRNISPKNQNFQKLIQHISGYADVGIHPSYLSGDRHEELAKEIKYLREIIGKPVTQSRQHFLRMDLPNTYRRLLKEGITSDYTMGYAEQIGFRSGTCTPHFFFDLDENIITTMKIYPLTVMEGTLRDYLKLNPEQAKEEYKKLIRTVQEVGGTFISLWHNDSLQEDGDWREVFQFMANELNESLNSKAK
jgi:hypothetical protein